MGNLPWAMHNAYMQYRYTMDEDMLREKIYPLLKRSINFYFHVMVEGEDGKIHLPVTNSPEYGNTKDCNYDLALLRWAGVYDGLLADGEARAALKDAVR